MSSINCPQKQIWDFHGISQMFTDFHICFIRRFPMVLPWENPWLSTHQVSSIPSKQEVKEPGMAMGRPWVRYRKTQTLVVVPWENHGKNHGKTMGFFPCFMIFFEGFPEFQLAQWRNRRVESFHWNGNALNATLSVTSAKLRRACSQRNRKITIGRMSG